MEKKLIAMSYNTSHYGWIRSNVIKKFLSNGYSVVVISPRDNYTQKLEEIGARHIDIPMKMDKNPFSDILLLLKYYTTLKKERPIVFLGYTIKPNIYGSIAAHMLNIPVINNIAGLGALFTKRSWVTQLVKSLYKFSLSRSQKVFFQNKDDIDLFISEKIVTHKNYDLLPGSGVDLEKYQHTLTRKDLYNGKLVFLLIARMLWDKGVQEFVDAARLVKSKNNNVEFLLLGPADVQNPTAISRDTIEKWVAEGVVKYLGVSDDVRNEIGTADCVVLPSYYREGVPRSLLEAAAMGKPIITTNAVGCKEVVDDGINGYLCNARDSHDLAEKITKIIELTEEERKAMGVNSRKKVEQYFDEEMVLNKYLNAISELKS